MEVKEIKPVVEALLLVADVPLNLARLKELMGRVAVDKVRQAIDELREEYRKRKHAFTISEVAEGYLLSTLPQYSDWIKKLYKGRLTTKLSKPSLETLAIVAFKQPITRTDVEAIRGVDAGGVLSTLLERKLIAISGRDNSPGKPLIYVTTKEFLRYFGLNKLSDLPRPRELEELLKEREQEQIDMFGDTENAVNSDTDDSTTEVRTDDSRIVGDKTPEPGSSTDDTPPSEASDDASEDTSPAADADAAAGPAAPDQDQDVPGQPEADDPDEKEDRA